LNPGLYEKRFDLDIDLVGVLTNNKGEKIKNYCFNNDIPLLSNLNEYLGLSQVDIAISVQYHEILKKKHISKAKDIIINLHMAPLPEYRGCNQFTFAIINGDKIFGTTIHKLEEGIDSGAIIFEKRFTIPVDCWVDDLYKITYNKTIELFKESLPYLISANYELKPQESYFNQRKTSFHYRKEIEEVKKINLNWNKDKIKRYIRATYMPGFAPPYFLINNQKIFFSKGN